MHTVETTRQDSTTLTSSDQQSSAIDTARAKLQRAYVLVSFGYLEEAIEVCAEVDAELPDHPMASTLQGAFLIASGQTQAALKHLGRVMRRHPQSTLTRLYFCEACLLSGRVARGLKELERLDDAHLDTEDLRSFARSLKEVFEGIDPATLPDPLVVRFDADGMDADEA